jgi:hypothetical protein
MRAANYLRGKKPAIFRGHELTKSTALQYAWYFNYFRRLLRNGVYSFCYFKTDGTIRQARGTLVRDRIPEDLRPHTRPDLELVERIETFNYYDLDAKGWRSFRLDNFIGLVVEVESPLRNIEVSRSPRLD